MSKLEDEEEKVALSRNGSLEAKLDNGTLLEAESFEAGKEIFIKSGRRCSIT